MKGRTKIADARVVAEMFISEAKSRKDICRQLKMSKGSISRIVNRLLKSGVVEEGEKIDHPRRGRKTTLLHIRPDIGYVLGTDLEGMAVRACLLNCSNKVIASSKRALVSSWSMEKNVKAWMEMIEKVIKTSCVNPGKIIGIGVGLPGLVSKNDFRAHSYLPPGRWIDLDIKSDLSRFGLPITAANNVICVSEYERRIGIVKGEREFISILARYGIGVAVYSHGSFLIGEKVFTGEFGHMRLDIKGPVCVCGQRGCLDVFVSGRTCPDKAHQSGIQWKRELQKRTQYLAIGIANLLKIFHPPTVILNGIYNEYKDEVAPILRNMLANELDFLGIEVPRIMFGEPMELKASIGAAFLSMDKFFEPYLLKNMFINRA